MDKITFPPDVDYKIGGGYVNAKYHVFYEQYGYIPQYFNPYNLTEIHNISPTITSQCGSTTSSSTILITNLG